MNLFCVGLSHHTANVETRERFAGHAETDCILRRGRSVQEAGAQRIAAARFEPAIAGAARMAQRSLGRVGGGSELPT